MITVKLLGNLGYRFVEEIELAIGSVEEALRALRANFPEFAAYLFDAARSGLHYRICANGQVLEAWQMRSPLPENCTITIAPIPQGAGTTFRIIAGVALLGLGIAGVGFLGIAPTTLAITGAALLLGALHGRVKKPGDENKKSLIFSGPQTTTQEGGRVWLAYGLILTGWIVISARIRTTYQAG